jgi:hypothetical protein
MWTLAQQPGRKFTPAIPTLLLDRSEKDMIGSDGNVDLSRWLDADIFDVNSFAAAAGFRDARYFVAHVLYHPKTPFQYYPITLVDAVSGHDLLTTYATHQNSAAAGGEVWRSMKAEETRARCELSTSKQTVVTSLHQFG